MTATKRAGASNGAGPVSTPPLPTLAPVTLARLEETGTLLERLFDENVTLFIRKGQEFKERHREGTTRHLFAAEAAQIAAALVEDDEDRVVVAETVQASNLRAYDQPDQRDILLAAGLATAPQLMQAVRKVVALVELPADTFEKAAIAGRLAEAIDAGAAELRQLEVGVARARAVAALEHYAASAGYDVGEAWRLPVQAVWQALTQAVRHLDTGSRSSQLTGSVPPTGASPATTSSTDSPGPTPST